MDEQIETLRAWRHHTDVMEMEQRIRGAILEELTRGRFLAKALIAKIKHEMGVDKESVRGAIARLLDKGVIYKHEGYLRIIRGTLVPRPDFDSIRKEQEECEAYFCKFGEHFALFLREGHDRLIAYIKYLESRVADLEEEMMWRDKEHQEREQEWNV